MLDNINPKLWGNSFWDMIHYIAMSYPNQPTDDDKNNIKSFILSLKNILPCEKCRLHLSQNLINFPLSDDVLRNKHTLFKWSVDLHNEVNLRSGKKIYTIDQAFRKYNGFQNNNDQLNPVTLLIITLIVILVIYLKYF